MRLSLIAALAENRVIGRDGDLPWNLPADLRRFKALTLDHTLVMGRKTHESIGRPLPRRRSLVVSRDPFYEAEGVEVARGLEAALELVQQEEEVFVIGGSEVFRRALPEADRLYLTWVHAEIEGDVFFPPFDESRWRQIERERHEADEQHAYPYSFCVYERCRETAP